MTMFPRHLAERLTLAVLALTGLVTAAVYRALPDRIATHFDWQGRADSWQPRALAVVLLPGVALALSLLLRVATRGAAPQRRALAWVAAGSTAFLCMLHMVLLANAKRPGIDVVQLTCIGAGALFAGLGLLLPKVQQNPWVGVRTYWTLRSPEVWARTQRVAGTGFFLGGAALVVLAAWIPSMALPALLALVVVVPTLATGYSWRISRAA